MDDAKLLARALGCEREGRIEDARALYESLLARDPDHPGALLKLGLIAQAAGRLGDAKAMLVRAAAEARRRGVNASPVALALAELERAQGDVRAAARTLGEAVEHAPSDVRLRMALAQALKACGDIRGALAALDAATVAAPDSVETWLALAGLSMEVELATPSADGTGSATALPRALAAFERALALAPDAPAILSQAAMALRYACAWQRAEACEARLRAVAADTAVALVISPMIAAALLEDAALQARAIRDFAARTLPPPAPAAEAPAFVRSPGSRLRVGYLSADFHEHATAHLAAGLFERHDRTKVETFAYALDRDDGSAVRQRLLRAFAHWRDVRALPDAAVAARIAADRLDVLVDLKGHTRGSRLAILARRPAPVQLHYLGFPGTLAYGAIDGLIADGIIVPPGEERHYAERVLRMPACYQVNDRDRPLPPAPSRASVGLPERGLVLVSFNQTYKLGRAFVDGWLDVLARHGETVLWLTVPQALARDALLEAARQRGVAEKRIVFAPFLRQSEHLARLRCADLALDVLPYGSHTTGSDALWCGVPLLTLAGRTFAGRVGASLVSAAGLADLATGSMDSYRSRLEALVSDRPALAGYREHLERERFNLPLFDTERFTRDFERLLEDVAPSHR